MTIVAPLSISHYDHEIPQFAEAELDRLYGTMYSSLAHFRVHGGAENASTYVVRRGDDIITIILFRRERHKIRVINEWIRLTSEDVERFANYIFAAFPFAAVITFHAVWPDSVTVSRPSQRAVCGEDIVATLPDSVDAYIASLGSATRKNIKRHKNRLERLFPSFSFRCYVKDEVDEQHVRDIIRFNRTRMARKGKISKIDVQREEQLLRMVRERGFVTVMMIDGRVCGGAITLHFGDTYVSRVNAHDPEYDDYRLGMLCCFMTICECIRRGAKRFDFMWGQYEYKTALLGVRHELEDLILYRSRPHMVLCAGTAIRTVATVRLRAAKQRLLQFIRQPESRPAWLRRGVQLAHGCRQMFSSAVPKKALSAEREQ
jgi:hypothetical protein